MKPSSKAVAGTGAVLGVVIVTWIGASVYSAGVAEKDIKAFASRPSSETGVRIHNLQHQAGLLSSSGSFGIELVSQCAEDLPAGGPIAELEYSVSHLILPGSLARIQWSAAPAGDFATALAALMRSDARLTGEGTVGLGGGISTSLALPELAANEDGYSFTLSPSNGSISVGGTTLDAHWRITRIVARGGGEALDLRNIVLDAKLSDRTLGTGTTSLAIDKIATSYGTAEGFRHATQTSEKGDRLHLQVSESLKSVSVAGQAATDLILELALRDLDKKSIETIAQVFSETCGLQHLTTDEDSRFRTAVRTLITQGFSVGISKLAGSIGKGSIQGQFMLEAGKAGNPSAPIELARALRSSGELVVKGDALTSDHKEMALALGLFEQLPDTLKASFEYTDGLLRTNGRVLDAGDVQNGLRFADTAINTFLDAPLTVEASATEIPQAPIQQAHEDEEEAGHDSTPDEAESSAPLAANAATPDAPAEAITEQVDEPLQCISDESCLWMTLLAAANEDIDAVRNLAVEIEALPKPAPGNRAVSRKLNDEGLAMLKAGQPDAAAELFGQGLQENPRDVELAGNLGFALIKADKPAEAAEVLVQALRLDPRRSSTWTPLAEALALAGYTDESQAALWVAYQWSGNRDKSLTYYADRAAKEAGTRPALAELFGAVLPWVTEGRRPALPSLTAE
ncbi:DUF945 family protein [Thauera sp.]|uniref:DUF945 family protein n=1 Tax=Thauera sp. TaxID=1905334 RepID=UPI00257DC21B|nr:DUF945 family protein [Thauera sp.]